VCSRGKKRVRRKGQQHREHTSRNQRVDQSVGHGHRFDRKQRNNGCRDQEDRGHAHRLATGEQQKLDEDQEGDGEEQDERTIDENLSQESCEGASGHHHGNKGETLLDANGPTPGQELNGKHGRQEGEVPPEHLAEREAHGGGKGYPEGKRMGLAGFFGLCRYGGSLS
jgi:hypothetical protein